MRATVHEEVKVLGALLAKETAAEQEITKIKLEVAGLITQKAAAEKAGKGDETERLGDLIESRNKRIQDLQEEKSTGATRIAKAKASVEAARNAFVAQLPHGARKSALKVMKAETKKFQAKQKAADLEQRYHAASGDERKALYNKWKKAEAKFQVLAAKFRIAAKKAEIHLQKAELKHSRKVLAELKAREGAAVTREDRAYLVREIRRIRGEISEKKEAVRTLKAETKREKQTLSLAKTELKAMIKAVVSAVKKAAAPIRK
jgi:chromosome segregation ATPase